MVFSCNQEKCNIVENIDNKKIITARITKITNSKTGLNAQVEYYYNFKNYIERKIYGCYYCYHLDQEILIYIDTLNPSDFDFVRDTFIIKDKSANISNVQKDTLIARNFDYNSYTKCVYFDLYKGFQHLYHSSKLVRKKPQSTEMYFIYYENDMYENELKLKR